MSTPEVYESPSPARRSVGLEALTEGDSLALRLTDVDLGRIYSAELCAADARASGLDEETLHEQVTQLYSRFRRAAPPDEPDDLLLQRARFEAGVEETLAPTEPAVVTELALSSPGARPGSPGDAPSSSRGWKLARESQVKVAALTAVQESLEQQEPYETSRTRRAVQHLSSAMSPLAAVAAGAASAGAVGVVGVAAAGVAAAGGLASSMTTHEHHTQSQAMSRQLQRIALEQDRKLHEEAQLLCERRGGRGTPRTRDQPSQTVASNPVGCLPLTRPHALLPGEQRNG